MNIIYSIGRLPLELKHFPISLSFRPDNTEKLWYSSDDLDASLDASAGSNDLSLSGIPVIAVDLPKRIKPDMSTKRQFRSQRQQLAEQIYADFNKLVFNDQLPKNIEIKWSTTLRKTAGHAR
jgi:hypothetical protein